MTTRDLMTSATARGLATLALCLALVVLAALSSEFEHAHAQFAGRVAGVVINGTAGGTVPEGFEVVLLTTDAAGNQIDQRTTRVDSKGTFEFTNVSSGDEVLNRVVTDYQGVINTIRLEDEITPANLTIRIFETTRSLDSINVVSEVMVARPDGQSRILGFLELITFRNDGDRTFVADLTDPSVTGLSMLRFGLPENYERLEDVGVDPPLPAGRLVEVGPGFALTNPVPPGEYRIIFAYLVRYKGSTFEFGRNLPFGAQEVRVLMPKGVAQVTGEEFKNLEDVTLGKSIYSVTAGSGYARGDRVVFTFSDLPQPSLWQSVKDRLQGSKTYVKVGVPVAAAVVMAGLLGYVFLMRRRRGPGADAGIDATAGEPGAGPAGDQASAGTAGPATGPNPPTADVSAAEGDRESLVRQIALLDQQFEAGEIEETEHRRRRADLTARALGNDAGKAPEP